MRSFSICALCLFVPWLSPSLVEARLWTSAKGDYKIEADAITFNEELVVLRKITGQLVAVELKDLSKEDQDFVLSKEAKDAVKESVEKMQTWTAKDGMKVRGRVLAYGRKEVVLQRRFGKVHIDDKAFDMIDALHQKLILKVLSHLESQTLEDEKQLEDWAKTIGGNPRKYTLDGVLMQLESGDEIGVPFFLFAPEELAVLEPGWKLWLEQHESDEAREHESFMVHSAALAYQRDRAANQQIEMLKLDMLAAATGAVAIWQVGLAPRPGTYGRPTTVMVTAQNSGTATRMALQRYPGFTLVGVRRASR